MTIGRMVLVALVVASWAAPATTTAQDPDPDEVWLYTRAIEDLIGEPVRGTFYLAEAILGEGGRTISSEIPETVARELAAAGYHLELAHLSESGLWDVPQRQLFLALGELEMMPGRKLARLRVLTGSGSRLTETVAFTFRKQDDEWVLVERGPAGGG